MNVHVLGDDYAPVTTMLGVDYDPVTGKPLPGFFEKVGKGFTDLGTGVLNILKTDTTKTTVGSRLADIGVSALAGKLTPTQKANLELLQQQRKPTFFEQNQTLIIVGAAVALGAVVILKTKRPRRRYR